MPPPKPKKEELAKIKLLVAHYLQPENQSLISTVKDQVLVALGDSETLRKHIHSIRSRIKDPRHLKDKLLRKLLEAKVARRAFDITPENLLVKISDLVGIRILHLHTRQFSQIDQSLRDIFHQYKYRITERPFARTWDDESRGYFKGLGIKVEKSPTLYTSVHYLIEPVARTRVRCEVQVRTLMEEVWGEVDHALNYPKPAKNVACTEQIKALARVTSSATRLVDSIFATAQDLEPNKFTGYTTSSSPTKREL